MKNHQILRQNIGIDVGMFHFYVRHTIMDIEGNIKHSKAVKFSNKASGFKTFLKWAKKISYPDLPLRFTMEATGVYYEGLAYFLYEQGEHISVLLPNMAKKFAESLNIKSKTDKIDARTLGQLGVERNLPKWKLGSKIYRDLKKLSRERQRLIKQRTAVKNRLHSEEHSGDPLKIIIKHHKDQIKFLNRQIEKIEKTMKEMIARDHFLSEKFKKITTIPGVSFITAVTIVAETQGFENFRSLKQLWSYAGYDVRQRQSGKFRGRTRISKKGNKHIRRAMYMPVITLIQHSQTYRKFFSHLKKRKEKGMIALTAVQRKLLGLIYTLWKNDAEFIDNYEEIKQGKKVKQEKHVQNGIDDNKEKSSGSQSPTTQDRQSFQTETCLPSAYTKVITLKNTTMKIT